ncbi:uncharacterized protein BT62DRAFT_442952 [Guyanagaster necrorhizus]|uniref:Uncharacterized protein n=1 Tax=Guyanagaster necrorhizus TaxID=856835 RepID=A0A9P7VKQ0_9AGAR|nr:uncharacterized protein BT62DRAFT_442952 [Guyanagaster necrorhizus MCA 3950]KAG7442272.1 hypothetical protein BT62DRAFT_442952 [Guyanagaster necrorhizus MCA 3950]
MASFFQELKDKNRGALHIFAMSNISQPDYEALRSISADTNWSFFDDIFTSFLAGRRKPNLGFYRYTLSQATSIPLEPFSQTTSSRMHSLRVHRDYMASSTAREEVAASTMDEVLMYVNEDGIVQTYFDHTRPRIDPVVCVNVLSLFYSYGRGNEMNQTLERVYQVLLHRAYLQGSRYYETAESFLFFLYRFIGDCDNPAIHSRFYPLLKESVMERIGTEGDGLALAMRLIVCNFTDVKNDIDLQTLRGLQPEDGGWDTGLIYKYGSSGLSIRNRGLTTVMAIHAIQRSNFASSSL